MKKSLPHADGRKLDITYQELLPFFDGIDGGLIIVDRKATIIYYNAAMATIDDLDPTEAVNQRLLTLYELTEDSSIIMQCLKSRRPIIDRPLLYRTRRGKVANTIHTVFPLFNGYTLEGAICLVREYNVLEETISSISIPRSKKMLPNETRFVFTDIVGSSIEFLRTVNTARMAARTPSPVMLCGETGTGKELFAQSIHNQSDRKSKHYLAVNCAAIPENLLEGLLFGTTCGSFTGAKNKQGLFERADGGTIFLDEVNSMGTSLQAKILRVIQERKVRRLGSLQETTIDIKIISSVNKEPHLAIAENALRPDLFYRLGVVFIPIPPLRERREDIVLLARHFLAKHSRALNREVSDISDEVLALFHEYDWPGNVRELEHVIEGAINMVVSSSTIEKRHLQSHLTAWRRLKSAEDNHLSYENDLGAAKGLAKYISRRVAPLTVKKGEPDTDCGGLLALQAEREKKILISALSEKGGNVTSAARSVGISRQLFAYKMKKYRIDRNVYRH